jgi:magnesium chelatase family protein
LHSILAYRRSLVKGLDVHYQRSFKMILYPAKLSEEKVQFSPAQLEPIETVSSQENLSSRSTLKILRLARMIADVLDEETVTDAAV